MRGRKVVAWLIAVLLMIPMVASATESQYVPDNDVDLSQGGTHYTPPESGSTSIPPELQIPDPPSQSQDQGQSNQGGQGGQSNQGGQGNQGSSGDLFDPGAVEDYTSDLFDLSEFHVDNSSDNKVVKALNSKAMWLISILCGIFPALILFHFAVDILCMLSPTIRQFFATRKHQYFSDEVAKNFGFSLQSGGQQGYAGGAVQPPPSTPAGGQPGQSQGSPIAGYLQQRLILIVICLLLMVLCGSGQLFRLLGWVVNMIIHLLSSFTT